MVKREIVVKCRVIYFDRLAVLWRLSLRSLIWILNKMQAAASSRSAVRRHIDFLDEGHLQLRSFRCLIERCSSGAEAWMAEGERGNP